MDIHYFFSNRLSFIEQFYALGSAPFVERKRRIEDAEEPFVPPYSEEEEPAFQAEWVEAGESLIVLGYTCVSMLATALKLYFEAWIKQSGRQDDPELKRPTFKRKGWLEGYGEYFLQQFGIDFRSGSLDLSIIEEIILARNVIEHPPEITDMQTQFGDSDLKKIKKPLFINDSDRELSSKADDAKTGWYVPPWVYVTENSLAQALSESKKLVNWLEPQFVGRL